jgi:multisubunit Na+/H+ antiporter MnhB subunit
LKWVGVAALTVLALVLAWYELPRLTAEMKRERTVFLVITVTGWGLGSLLIFFPEMPGLTQLVDFLYRPLYPLIGKGSGNAGE